MVWVSLNYLGKITPRSGFVMNCFVNVKVKVSLLKKLFSMDRDKNWWN